uniref:Uncharacterized protein n=1 Tax=Anguilla anguilla TaxID=7936 RepID=A0A0E9RBI4_ANGAN
MHDGKTMVPSPSSDRSHPNQQTGLDQRK